MRQFIFGFIAALTLIAAGGLSCAALGLAPVATTSAPLPFEKLMTGYRVECARQQRSAEIIADSGIE